MTTTMTGWLGLTGRVALVAGCGGSGRGCIDAIVAEGARPRRRPGAARTLV